jgi:diguanylate cyclase (GGDEF)-like protein/PAS domain S-box-containing protein
MHVQHAYAPGPAQICLSTPEQQPGERMQPLLDRAMASAKVGAWSCTIPDERLSWTEGVYNLFGLPAGTPVDRQDIVDMYAEESREAMDRLRSKAIAQGGTFTLDAQIKAADGARRWMRLTGEMVRQAGQAPCLHGLKQDITEDKLRWEEMRRRAESDVLTGLANRAAYESRFLNRTNISGVLAPVGALVLFDLDGFKEINDRFGHAAGDTCLRVFAERLSASFPQALLTARIGGDEFAVIVGDGSQLVSLERQMSEFLKLLRAPVLWQGHMLAIGASTGIATPPNPYFYDAEELYVSADAALYAAKRARRET